LQAVGTKRLVRPVYSGIILNDQFRFSLHAAYPFCRESESKRLVQCTALRLVFYSLYLNKVLEVVSFGSQRMLHPISSLPTVCQSCGGVNTHVLPDGFLIFGANIVNVRLFALTVTD